MRKPNLIQVRLRPIKIVTFECIDTWYSSKFFLSHIGMYVATISCSIITIWVRLQVRRNIARECYHVLLHENIASRRICCGQVVRDHIDVEPGEHNDILSSRQTFNNWDIFRRLSQHGGGSRRCSTSGATNSQDANGMKAYEDEP